MTNLTSGRVNQKLRTREKLVSTAIEMVRSGETPSVADVADAAGVGRTTAYRYFPTQTALLTDVILYIVEENGEQVLYQAFATASDPEERLDAVVTANDAALALHRAAFRAVLRLTLEPHEGDGEPLHRPAYRTKWLVDALSPLRRTLGARRFDFVIAALSLCVGVESSIVLEDVCAVETRQATEVKRWVARTILHAALAEAGVKPKPVRARPSSRRSDRRKR